MAVNSWGLILPGRPGWLPTRAPHRPTRAQLRHVVPQIIASLRNKSVLPWHTEEQISSLNAETSPTAYQDSLNAD